MSVYVSKRNESKTFVKGKFVPEFAKNRKPKRTFDVDGWTLLAWLLYFRYINFIASSTLQ